MGKKIILLSDGTGNAASQVWRTNVWRTFESLDLTGSGQVAYYDDGVGTSTFKPLAILGGAFGYGLKRNVLDLYKFACRNYRDGEDELFGFGFSRGAFTMRVVTGFILNQGLVRYSTEAELDNAALQAYRTYRREKYHSNLRIEDLFRGIRDLFVGRSYDKANNIPVAKVRFLGLWDTVAAYGLPMDEMTRGVSQWIWPLELPDRTLSPKVERACHALALDDERTTFHPVLWNERGEQPALPDAHGVRHTFDERISQVWFVGMHSNAGGGYPDDSLAHIPLVWMLAEAARCGLKFKETPTADPDALVHIKSVADKDGRIYDSRQGLGGYYRYGPRKMVDLCHARISSTPGDEVEIVAPKIHESVFKRIKHGAQTYAPIGLPASYELVSDTCEILPVAQSKYETPLQADNRGKLQERVWDVVWWRRLVYFLTIAATAYLVLYPLFRSIPRSAEYSASLRPISDAIRLVGVFLPGGLDTWINAYARDSFWFLCIAGLVIGLISLGTSLASKITDGMHAIWQVNTPTAAPFPDSWLYRLRTNVIYKGTIDALKWRIAPFLFALVFLYLGATLPGHLFFYFADLMGFICEASQNTRGMARGERREVQFQTSDICAATGIAVEERGRYRITVTAKPETPWFDGSIPTDVGGFYITDLDDAGTIARFFAALPLKRVWTRPWFRVIARVGATGSDEDFLDPDVAAGVTNRLQEILTPRRSGELFFYVSDAILPLPSLWDLFYSNNRGTGSVTVERL